jgi:hypothetical protein
VTDFDVDGSATVYRQYDVGYAIDLERVANALGASTRGRARPGRIEAQAIQIRNPPLVVELGERDVTIAGHTYQAGLSANVFDFGVCSLQLRIAAPRQISWTQFAEFGRGIDDSRDITRDLDREMLALLGRMTSAVQRPEIAPLSEEYVVFRIDRLASNGAHATASDLLTDDRLAPLLLGERRSLSQSALRELLPHRFSYYANDLTVLSWDNALVVEPREEDRDVEYILEFANAQLLELRLYDAQLDADLPKLYERVAVVRGRRYPPLTGRFRTVLADLHTRVADITEIVERVENALKVTNDVYLARIYAASLELFRERNWRRGIERKLEILRETYTMLHTEAQASRTELLELAIVLLIIFEIVLSFLRP